MNCRTLTAIALLGAASTFTGVASANPGMPVPAGHIDNDGDGYVTKQTGASTATPAGYDIDCDDTSASVNPGAREIPGNGRRDDCVDANADGTIDAADDEPLSVQDDSEVGKWSRGPWYRQHGGVTEALLTADILACEYAAAFADGGCSVNYDDYTFTVSNPNFRVGYFCAFGTLEYAGAVGGSGSSLVATCVPNRTKQDGLDVIPAGLASTMGPVRSAGLGRSTVTSMIDEQYETVVDPRLSALEARADAGDERDAAQDELIERGQRTDVQQNVALGQLMQANRQATAEREQLRANQQVIITTVQRHDEEIKGNTSAVTDLQATGIQLSGVAGYRYMGMTPIVGDDGSEDGVAVRSAAHSFMGVGARLDYVVVPQLALGVRGEIGFGGDDVAGDSSDRVWLLGGGATYRFLAVPGLELGANFQGGRLTSAQNPIFFSAQDNLFVAEATLGYEVLPSTRARIKIEGFAGGGSGAYSVLGSEQGDEVVTMGKGNLSTFGIRLHLGGDRPVPVPVIN